MEHSGIRDRDWPSTTIPDSGAARLHPGYALAITPESDRFGFPDGIDYG